MYTVLHLFCIGFFIGSGCWLIWLCLFIKAVVASARIRDEERLLIKEFGHSYIEYMKGRGAFCCLKVCDCGIRIDDEKEGLLIAHEANMGDIPDPEKFTTLQFYDLNQHKKRFNFYIRKKNNTNISIVYYNHKKKKSTQ
ncbi:hypothetical protein RFI_26046 [Reticulomyxa filosa]|uniref:Uncharacterized protein n=1 Tax=Reticulomyxa filosa TaxID=46433 RepID=X6ME66_RETFI|nr:hypothetical protein RFI_26046 [Reticulomyxa filosa]|eukprot:ETO11330.1 hypothetical protein RFI_26046 [Reticulomyxa filosa]